MRRGVFLLALTVLAATGRTRTKPDADGEIVVQQPIFGQTLILKASTRFAGAIYSIQWRGREFLNSFDHGRELQTAVSFDGYGECYNPTEAGSQRDAGSPNSTSELLALSYSDTELQTTADAAFWMSPGQRYPTQCGLRAEAREAKNGTDRGGYRISKRVHLGHERWPNVLEYDVTLELPRAHSDAVVELVTGYMPPEFSEFLSYDPKAGVLGRLTDGPGEQGLPVILSTPDRKYAMGVYSPEVPQRDTPQLGYGRFRFVTHSDQPGEDTVKWNCVFRRKNVAPGRYSWRVYVFIGSVEEIQPAMRAIASERR